MKRYILFGFDHYYPCGGWGDFVCDGDTVDELRPVLAWAEPYELADGRLISAAYYRHGDDGFDGWHIVDTQTMTIVERGSTSETKEVRR